ncbi:hypothetical protein [Methanobrevibacter sp.]|uniref:hypothetical protein n=1 Tax=Methanobrevibacter sp. TaxID=66852 RepID=UPI00388FA7B0
MAEISFDIDDNLLKDFRRHMEDVKSSPDELIEKYIRQGLIKEEGRDTMVMVCLNENVTEKVNIVVKLTGKTPEEVVNENLWDNLEHVEDIPDEIDYEKIWNMLDHDKPEGDDVLDRLSKINKLNQM